MLESRASFHDPTRRKMCEGMCSACGTAGAVAAYARDAGKPRSASESVSYAWIK